MSELRICSKILINRTCFNKFLLFFQGTAYTLFTPNNGAKARDLVEVLTEAKQVVNPKLLELAQCGGGFGGRSRYGGGGRGGRSYGGGRGGGRGRW